MISVYAGSVILQYSQDILSLKDGFANKVNGLQLSSLDKVHEVAASSEPDET